jgi:hypothetical protein
MLAGLQISVPCFAESGINTACDIVAASRALGFASIASQRAHSAFHNQGDLVLAGNRNQHTLISMCRILQVSDTRSALHACQSTSTRVLTANQGS